MTGKRRKKLTSSRYEIVLGVAMLSLVANMTGCDESSQRRQCVDRTGRIVAEEQCRDEETRHYYGGGVDTFFWYYGGSGAGTPGSVASGGSYNAPRGYYGGGRFPALRRRRAARSAEGALGAAPVLTVAAVLADRRKKWKE